MYANKLNIPLGLTFDDVLLIPAQSYVEPSEADILYLIYEKHRSQ